MTDIDELTGAALNRAVAEALGFEIVDRNSEDGWLLGMKRGDDGEFMPYSAESLPDYAHDLNAAVALPMDEYYIAKHREDGIHASVNFGYFGRGDTPATAICRAWLKYMDAHAERDAAQERRDMGRQGDKL